jgi:hypothetical protein
MSMTRLIRTLVRKGWSDFEIHALLKSNSDIVVIDKEINDARKVEEVDASKPSYRRDDA